MKLTSTAIVALTFLLTCKLDAQWLKKSLTRTEAYSYANLVGNYLDANDSGIITRTELVMMFLEMDTIGRVTKIHLMGDDQSEKSLYGILKGIKPEYFNNEGVIYAAKEKTIIFPIYSYRYYEDPNNYMDKISRSFPYPFMTEDMSATVLESYKYIHVNGTTHVVGRPKIEKPPVCMEPEIVTGKKVSDKQAIYAVAINHLYGNSPASIVIDDSTSNSEVSDIAYLNIANSFKKEARSNPFNINIKDMDSTWISALIEADKKKNSLATVKLPIFKPRCIYVQFVNRDSIRKSYNNPNGGFSGTFHVGDRVNLSTIILIGNKAIVGAGRICGSLCGEGVVYFLEKKNGRWMVISEMRAWIS